MTKTRLTPEKWIQAGISALLEGGPTVLAAETLARQLNTTKGSFYWHFRDVPTYHRALLLHWQTARVADAVALLEGDARSEERLRQLGRSVLADPLEPALRAWGQTVPHVADAIAEVDAQRLSYITHLLRPMGLSNPAFAKGLLAALVGLPLLNDGNDAEDAFGALVDTVLALA